LHKVNLSIRRHFVDLFQLLAARSVHLRKQTMLLPPPRLDAAAQAAISRGASGGELAKDLKAASKKWGFEKEYQTNQESLKALQNVIDVFAAECEKAFSAVP
jgi:hypothetical protein